MAYRGRSQYNKRRTSRRKPKPRIYPNNRYNFTYGNVLDKMVGDVARLKGLINTEFKQADTTATGVVGTTASILLINGLAKGDDFDTRDGRQVRMKSAQIAITYKMSQSATFSQIRCMVVIDKQPNEILLVITDLLDSQAMQTFRNLDQRKRFVILKDEVVSMSIDGEQGGIIKWYKRMDMKSIYDDSDAGDITDISTNALYLILFSTEATNTVTISRSTRVRYIDN